MRTLTGCTGTVTETCYLRLKISPCKVKTELFERDTNAENQSLPFFKCDFYKRYNFIFIYAHSIWRYTREHFMALAVICTQ